MTPTQLQQLKGNTQYHRDMSAYYLGRAAQGGTRQAETTQAPEAEPKAEEAMPPTEMEAGGGEQQRRQEDNVTPRIGTDADAYMALAETHAEAARQLEALVDVEENQSARRSLEEARQGLPVRGLQRGANPRRDVRAVARPSIVAARG